jgi:hypothetical protein
MIGYKLLRKRRDGTYGSLFINRRQRLVGGTVYPAKAYRKRGYTYRPGWHILPRPEAPHLSIKGRTWCRIEFDHSDTLERPTHQGGTWYLGSSMTILEEV